MYTYLNGRIVLNSEVRISPFDHGFLYGAGVFETFRTYEGRAFLLDAHLARLNESLKELNIALQVTKQQAESILRDLYKANGWPDAYIRFNVSAGTGDIGLQTQPYESPNVIVFQKQLPPAGPVTEKKGIWLEIRRNLPEGSQRLKSHHYLNNLFGKREAGKDPSVEGLFLTGQGFVAEGVVSNVFWIKDQVLYTPALETGILNGITRQFVMQTAREAGWKVEEGLYTTEQAESADEAFVTNSIQEIVPLCRIGKTMLPGKQGEQVRYLFTRYREAVHQ